MRPIRLVFRHMNITKQKIMIGIIPPISVKTHIKRSSGVLPAAD